MKNGDRVPSDDIKLKMTEIFGCTLDYLMGKSDIRNPEKINENDIDVAFATGIKGLNKENQEIAKSIIEGLLAKQNTEDKEKKD